MGHKLTEIMPIELLIRFHNTTEFNVIGGQKANIKSMKLLIQQVHKRNPGNNIKRKIKLY